MNKRIKKKILKRGGYRKFYKYRVLMKHWKYALEHGTLEWSEDGRLNLIVSYPCTLTVVDIDIKLSGEMTRELTDEEMENGVDINLTPIELPEGYEAVCLDDIKNELYESCNAYSFKYKENNNEEC